MEQKFIKYRGEQVNLARLYETSTGNMFGNDDLQDGTLVIGHYGDGKYLAMGYLCAMLRDRNTGKIEYEITNAIEGEISVNIQAPRRVTAQGDDLPCFAATSPDFAYPVVGKIYRCNGEFAVMYIGGCGKVTVVNVNSVLELVPYFKENG